MTSFSIYFKKLALFIVLFSTKVSFSARNDCHFILIRFGRVANVDVESFSRRTAELKGQARFIYDDPQPADGSGRYSFVISNETDLANAPINHEQRDFFIGFGNNSSWDFAFRTKAKDYVIADISYEPIVTQNHFF